MNITNENLNEFANSALSIVNFYNSKEFNALKKDLPYWLKSAYKDRLKYCDLGKKTVIEKIKNEFAYNRSVKLNLKSKNVDFAKHRALYSDLANNYQVYTINQLVSDFILANSYLIGMSTGQCLLSDLPNDQYIQLDNWIKSKGKDFITKGYPFDFYCHDAETINECAHIGKYWLCNNDYLSTHILDRDNAKDYLKKISPNMTIYCFKTSKFINHID